VTTVVIDDHLLRDVLTGSRAPDLGGIATALATTGLWLFRLSSAWAAPSVVRKLTAPVEALSPDQQDVFRLLVYFAHDISKWTPLGSTTALPGVSQKGLLPMWAGAVLFLAYGLAFALPAPDSP
jgi:hypothetical protein